MSRDGRWLSYSADIIINEAPLDGEDERRATILHEFAHTLGLEHTFDAEDGDISSDEPDASITLMSYVPPEGAYSTTFTPLDLAALAARWGLEAEQEWLFRDPDGSIVQLDAEAARNRLAESRPGEALLGPAPVVGSGGADTLSGASANDVLSGRDGDDVIRGGAGNDRINGNGGNDVLIGGEGADLFLLSRGNDAINDFSVLVGDRLLVSGGQGFSLNATADGNTQLIRELGVSTILGISPEQLEASGAIVVIQGGRRRDVFARCAARLNLNRSAARRQRIVTDV
ncbi:hypothetical protein [Synechococcus sp. RSCCF101]|uniref:hypothetical protein n=1 Tax=Synechococcus sp. RSCCF101 TaxID=2511069 RepID=UPI00272992B4|nr:hypothetical protein [Synechococcus sp. RSCCF101]